MKNIINLLTSQEMIVVYIVTGIAFTLYLIIYLIDRSYYKRKRRQNTKELNQLVADINNELEKEGTSLKEESPSDSFYSEPLLEPIENEVVYIEPIKVVNAKKEDIKEEVKETVSEIIPEEKISQEPKEVNLDDMLNKIAPPSVNNVVMEEVVLKENSTPIEELESLEVSPLEEKESVQEELIYTDIEPTKSEAQAELRRLTEELEQAEESSKNIALTSFEEEQEKDAIISLEELIKRSKEMYENNTLTQYEEENNVPISLADLERQIEKTLQETEKNEPAAVSVTTEELTEEPILEPLQQKMVLDDFNSVTITEEPVSKAYQTPIFKTSPIISPIFGIEKTINDNDMELENTANYEKLDAEIKKTNEFLATIKDLQKNLE